jgi:hypothetical protein
MKTEEKEVMDRNTDKNKDLEYTIVMDASYRGPQIQAGAEASGKPAEIDESKRDIDLLYDAYERMALMEPTILDVDDAYPHTYQWRMGDKYDPDKVAVVEEALREKKRITDTEAYKTYIDKISGSKFKPESWD